MCEKEIETENELVDMLKNMTTKDFEKLIKELDEAINPNKDLQNVKSNNGRGTK